MTRSIAHAKRVAFQGAPGAYANLAAREAIPHAQALPPSPLEKREKLEQLRALEANMSIAVARVDRVPLSVDTPADLERARQLIR